MKTVPIDFADEPDVCMICKAIHGPCLSMFQAANACPKETLRILEPSEVAVKLVDLIAYLETVREDARKAILASLKDQTNDET